MATYTFRPEEVTNFDKEYPSCQIQQEVKISSGYSISHAGNSLAKYKIQLAPSLRARSLIPGTTKCHVDLFPGYNPEVVEI